MEDYVGLEQGNASATDFVQDHTPATDVVDPVDVGGKTWQVLVSEDGREHALVQLRNGVTTMVTGTAPLPELVAFAESLTAADSGRGRSSRCLPEVEGSPGGTPSLASHVSMELVCGGSPAPGAGRTPQTGA